MLATALWLAALVGLVTAAVIANARGRSRPDDIVARGVIGIAAVAYAAIVASSIWVWGGTRAREASADRVAEGATVALELQLPGAAPRLHRTARAGDLLLVGPRSGLPAVVGWEVPALASPLALSIPADPTRCEAWMPVARRIDDRCELVIAATSTSTSAPAATSTSAPAATSTSTAAATSTSAPAATSTSAPMSPAMSAAVLRALPLVPDGDRVIERAWRVAIAIGGPAFAMLAIFACLPRRARRQRTFATATAAASVAAGLVALVHWRLVWAYRIDVMRELASAGTRVHANLLGAIAVGAALAGLAVALVVRAAATSAPSPGTRPHAFAATEARRRLAIAVVAAAVAWSAWLAVGLGLVGMPTGRGAAGSLLALSLATAMMPLVRAPRALRAGGPELALAAIAAAGIGARTIAPHFVFGKLALAFATVLAGHAALRDLLAHGTAALRRALLAAALVAAALALAHFDAGVALAIAGTGLALAMLVAGHDAAYDASTGARLGVLEREHARLVVLHAAAAALLAIGLAAAALVADAHALVAHGALAVTHAPIAAAVVFALAAAIARTHRRSWLPWLAASLACTALWAARDRLVERATAGDGVGAHRVAAVLEPGYALLADERAFAASASAWRETSLEAATPRTATTATTANIATTANTASSATVDEVATGEVAPDPWRGEGYFGARVRDRGVVASIDNDYLPVLVARDAGVAGLLATTALLVAIVFGAVAIAGARLGHASRAHRARLLVGVLAGVLVLYQPLASLGVLPLTGISWPGLGIDSPADLWMFVLGIAWIALPAAARTTLDDERVRAAPRVARARRLAAAALAIAALATTAIVARAGACALARVPLDDARIDAALRYAASLACPPRTTADVAGDPAATDGVPATADLVSHPEDAATTRFDRELRARYAAARPALAAEIARTGSARIALGWPAIDLTRTTCKIAHTDDAIAALRTRARAAAASPRIRVVAAAIGAAAADLGEVLLGGDHPAALRLRPGAAPIALGPSTTLAAIDTTAILSGPAQLFVASPTWHALDRAAAPTTPLDRTTLIVTPTAAALYTPGTPLVLADDGDPRATAARRYYPRAAQLPELGWVDPYALDHSLGLDGWIHAALATPSTGPLAAPAPAASSTGALVDATPPALCGTLAPPPAPPPCAISPRDGVLECTVSLQPELAARLDTILGDTLATAHATHAAYVLLRCDTGEIVAQATTAPGRAPLAFPPTTPAAEAALVTLLDAPGEQAGERIDWNAPLAAGSTIKPLVARAAEQAAPALFAHPLAAAGHAGRCPARRGKSVDPIFGHCPPTSVAAALTTADVRDFLAYSPNWYEAALGIAALGTGPTARLSVDHAPTTLAAVLARDAASIPTTAPLEIADATGPILTARHHIVTAGVRRTPVWQRLEQLLGRTLTTDATTPRTDVCATRALPLAHPSPSLRAALALGPDRITLPDGPVAEFFQLLRGSGARPLGSLLQIADAFGRVIYDAAPAPTPYRLAATWFPAPPTGTLPTYSCTPTTDRTATVLGDAGGLCAVVRPGGTAYAGVKPLLADPRIAIYGAKTGTVDSLAGLARRPAACAQWNATHPPASQLACGKPTPDDSLLVLAFSVGPSHVPFTLAIVLQRGGKGSAARAAPALVTAIADYVSPKS